MQVRQSPQTVQNVVTYDVVVGVDNPDLALMPGMTAATRIVAERRDDVLRVPDQALRYAPARPVAETAAEPRRSRASGCCATGKPRRSPSRPGSTTTPTPRSSAATSSRRAVIVGEQRDASRRAPPRRAAGSEDDRPSWPMTEPIIEVGT